MLFVVIGGYLATAMSFKGDAIGELSNEFSKAARKPTAKQRMLQFSKFYVILELDH